MTSTRIPLKRPGPNVKISSVVVKSVSLVANKCNDKKNCCNTQCRLRTFEILYLYYFHILAKLPKWFGERPGKKAGEPETPEGEEDAKVGEPDEEEVEEEEAEAPVS